ncbi:MAG: hypothetical protein M1839_006477 [Geoglossum umbratile]|nr:MAG: hypothetical protein M1839_006477 [Geoglossum umbratile]
MFVKSVFSLALLALSVSFASATPPACLLAAINAQGVNVADFSTLCGSKSSDVQSSIAKLCGNSAGDAFSAYADTCKTAGTAISTIAASATHSASSATATKSGSAATGSGNASPTGAAVPGSGMSLQPVLALIYSLAVIGSGVASKLL